MRQVKTIRAHGLLDPEHRRINQRLTVLDDSSLFLLAFIFESGRYGEEQDHGLDRLRNHAEQLRMPISSVNEWRPYRLKNKYLGIKPVDISELVLRDNKTRFLCPLGNTSSNLGLPGAVSQARNSLR
jgi:hypothetical protein